MTNTSQLTLEKQKAVAFSIGKVEAYLEANAPQETRNYFKNVVTGYETLRKEQFDREFNAKGAVIEQNIKAIQDNVRPSSIEDGLFLDWPDLDVCFLRRNDDDTGGQAYIGAVYLGRDGEPVLETPPPNSVEQTIPELAKISKFLQRHKHLVPTAKSARL